MTSSEKRSGIGMTDAVALKPDLGRFGCGPLAHRNPNRPSRSRSWATARVWIGGSPGRRSELRRPHPSKPPRRAGGHRHRQRVEPQIAAEVAEAYHRVEAAYPGRFLLGIGIGHPEHTEEYRKPYDVLVEYLDALDAAEGADQSHGRRRARPKVLELSCQSAVRAPTPI